VNGPDSVVALHELNQGEPFVRNLRGRVLLTLDSEDVLVDELLASERADLIQGIVAFHGLVQFACESVGHEVSQLLTLYAIRSAFSFFPKFLLALQQPQHLQTLSLTDRVS